MIATISVRFFSGRLEISGYPGLVIDNPLCGAQRHRILAGAETAYSCPEKPGQQNFRIERRQQTETRW